MCRVCFFFLYPVSRTKGKFTRIRLNGCWNTLLMRCRFNMAFNLFATKSIPGFALATFIRFTDVQCVRQFTLPLHLLQPVQIPRVRSTKMIIFLFTISLQCFPVFFFSFIVLRYTSPYWGILISPSQSAINGLLHFYREQSGNKFIDVIGL